MRQRECPEPTAPPSRLAAGSRHEAGCAQCRQALGCLLNNSLCRLSSGKSNFQSPDISFPATFLPTARITRSRYHPSQVPLLLSCFPWPHPSSPSTSPISTFFISIHLLEATIYLPCCLSPNKPGLLPRTPLVWIWNSSPPLPI